MGLSWAFLSFLENYSVNKGNNSHMYQEFFIVAFPFAFVKKNTHTVTINEIITEMVMYIGLSPPFSESKNPNIQVRKLAPDMMQTAI